MKNLPRLSKIYLWSIYLFPAVLFFSYYPVISLGSSESMNFELSLPLIYLVLFDIFSFVLIIKKHLFRNLLRPKIFLILLFPLYSSLSILWSSNQTRAILTAGILWLLYFAILSFLELRKNLKFPQAHQSNLHKAIFIPALAVSAWCWIQCLLSILEISSDVSLLCLGCNYQTFGFPHPNGFAIEPQFMGNLLLAPALLALYLWLQSPKKIKLTAILLFLSATIFLIFSRGAIYAFLIAATFMIIVFIVRQKTSRPLLALPILCLSFAFALNAQGLMSELSPTSDTYLSGVTKVIDQLTLGVFNLKVETVVPAEDATIETSSFSGYVAESTDIRLSLSASALALWSRTPTNLLFGVGLGSAGVSLYNAGLLPNTKEIVQNEYLSLLLETGLIGILLLILTAVLLFQQIKTLRNSLFIFTIIIAYAISLFFFAGLPNALHIYLLPPLLSKK